MDDEKQRIRNAVWQRLSREGMSQNPFGHIPPFEGAGKAAERLRSIPHYRQASTVMVPPDQAQIQVRLNCLQDRKRLIMATPGLRDGFYEITVEGLPVSRRREAVSSRGVVRFGRRLHTEFDEIGRVDLLVTGAVAVAMRGERLGKGTGFFDLEYQILRKVGSIHDETPVVTVVHDYQVFDILPHSPHDVPVCGIVTPTRWLPISDPVPVPRETDWGLLPVKLVKRMRPLWELVGKSVRQHE